MPQVTTMRKTGFLIALFAAALTGCGGGDSADDAFQPGTDTPTTPTAPVAASLTVTTSSPTILSDGSAPAEIKVFARNANNQFVSGVPIVLAASSGGLSTTGSATDASGMLAATLSPAGDPSRRTITVTATSGTVTASVKVEVGGSVLTVQGDAALTTGQTGTYTVNLVDAGNHGIANTAVTVTSARGNTLSNTSLTTNALGTATFTMRVTAAGNDTLTVSSAGLTATQAVTVGADVFTLSPPAGGVEIPLNSPRTVVVNWKSGGANVVGSTVSFSTTRGTVTPSAGGVTDALGNATATVEAGNAGGAVITATGGSNSTQLPIEFVATTPSNIDVQPSIFSIGTGQTSTLTAVVRDLAGNLVKNTTVDFTLVQDVTGGTLSVGSARTDSQGRAQTVYTASSTASANEGVKVRAAVHGTSIQKDVSLTVARRELFLSLGTGNTITEPNAAQYAIQYAVQVTDANGTGVANVPLSIRILSDLYYKGRRSLAVAPATGYSTTYTSSGGPAVDPRACLDEDTNRNGVLDTVPTVVSNEDFNGSGRLEAGNIATVSPTTISTDASGFALLTVTYPQEYAYYLAVSLSASTTVQGTEYVRTSKFMLPGSSEDFSSPTIAPPGLVSPFGVATACTDPN
jgi:hypothetical protein